MDNVSEQNFRAIQSGFNEMNKKVGEQEQRIKGLEGTIAQMKVQMTEMNQHMQVLRAITGGHGPTQ